MDLGLSGKKAIVTGGSRGIGRAVAEALAREGVDLAVCARGAEAVESAGKAIESLGVKVLARAVDVGDKQALTGFIAEAAEALGGLDILVANPSGGNLPGEKGWKANFEIDVMATVRSVEAAVPHLAKGDGGSVVLISSTAALETFMGPTSYNAMKAALITHSSGLSQALAPQGIRVNCVCPGPILIEGGAWGQIKQAMPKIYESTLAQCPQGRMGTADEVANAVTFLASPAASLITGVNLVVDGGFTKRVNF